MENSRRAASFGADPTRYRSYLLRLWREQAGLPWRCQVQCVRSGKVRRFDGLDGFCEFLVDELGGNDLGSTQGGGEGGDAGLHGPTTAQVL